MNKRTFITIQIVLDVLSYICFILEAVLGHRINPVLALVWVGIALIAHIELYEKED